MGFAQTEQCMFGAPEKKNNKKAATANRCGFWTKQKSGLTLGELLAAAG
jgi:hypothetical protein